MKRPVVLCIIVLAACSSALASSYRWDLNCCDSIGTHYGPQVRIGVRTPVGSTMQSWVGPTEAYCASLVYSGGLDSTMVKSESGFLMTNYAATAPASGWVFQVWAGLDYASSTLDVRIWASTAADTPSGNWKLFKLFDPVSGLWGREELGTVPIKNWSGSRLSPWFSATLAASGDAITDTPDAYGKGYVLSLEPTAVPEAGSVALALLGFAGLLPLKRRA